MKQKMHRFLVTSLFTVVFSLSLLHQNIAKAEALYLTSLEWPPYAGRQLPQQGTSIQLVREALRAMNHRLIVDFYPWSRAIAQTKNSQGNYVGYGPEYRYHTSDYIFSDPIGRGPLGLVERRDAPIVWSTLDDLESYVVGVVQDYVNTPALDDKIADGEITTQSVIADVQNILKVAAGHIDTAVIDANVFAYLATHNAQVAQVAQQLQMNRRLLTEKQLYIAFRNDEKGRYWRHILNSGLAKLAAEQMPVNSTDSLSVSVELFVDQAQATRSGPQ